MKATAFVVGPSNGPGSGLMDIARQLGFSAVMPYSGMARVDQQTTTRTPICFFLFAAVRQLDDMRGVAEAIRFSPSRRVRFSPMIYVCAAPSVDTISACVNMGFDDIIAMPSSAARFRERMERQLDRSLSYYETAGYFGPDRRNRGTPPQAILEQRVGGQFRRLDIVRNLSQGVTVVRDDLHVPPQPQPQPQSHRSELFELL